MHDAVPAYLAAHAEDYRSDPRAAALCWFRQARYGLFLHYGPYAITASHEWVQFRERIHVADYEAMTRAHFAPAGFDAEAITDLACHAGMRYVNLTTRHHDSFCLWRTAETPFNSWEIAGRDLVGELAAACAHRGLGLCLYYSHGRDWRHPHAPNNDAWGGSARPAYEEPEPAYATGDAHDLDRYLAFVERQITELLTGYGPIAAIWLDGIGVPASGDRERFRCQELYDRIHALQPQVLVSYKQGLTGTEDFFAPEHRRPEEDGRIRGDAPVEICTTMTRGSWGWAPLLRNRTAEEVWEMLENAAAVDANLLLNTGPRADGSLDPIAAGTLRAVGERLRRDGLPAVGS